MHLPLLSLISFICAQIKHVPYWLFLFCCPTPNELFLIHPKPFGEGLISISVWMSLASKWQPIWDFFIDPINHGEVEPSALHTSRSYHCSSQCKVAIHSAFRQQIIGKRSTSFHSGIGDLSTGSSWCYEFCGNEKCLLQKPRTQAGRCSSGEKAMRGRSLKDVVSTGESTCWTPKAHIQDRWSYACLVWS